MSLCLSSSLSFPPLISLSLSFYLFSCPPPLSIILSFLIFSLIPSSYACFQAGKIVEDYLHLLHSLTPSLFLLHYNKVANLQVMHKLVIFSGIFFKNWITMRYIVANLVMIEFQLLFNILTPNFCFGVVFCRMPLSVQEWGTQEFQNEAPFHRFLL